MCVCVCVCSSPDHVRGYAIRKRDTLINDHDTSVHKFLRLRVCVCMIMCVCVCVYVCVCVCVCV